MAITDLEALYPGKANPPSAAYPQGSVKNDTAPGAGDGTPINEDWLNDVWGGIQAVIAEGGVAPSGVPDTAAASDFLDALGALFSVVANRASQAEAEAGTNNTKVMTPLRVKQSIESGEVLFTSAVGVQNPIPTGATKGLYVIQTSGSTNAPESSRNTYLIYYDPATSSSGGTSLITPSVSGLVQGTTNRVISTGAFQSLNYLNGAFSSYNYIYKIEKVM